MSDHLSSLIVDDEQPARRLLRRALEEDGAFAQIVEVCNGEDAIETLQAQESTVLFLDTQMPQVVIVLSAS